MEEIERYLIIRKACLGWAKCLKIVTHHWSANLMKGFDIYKDFDDLIAKKLNDIEFTYIEIYQEDLV